MCEKKKNMVSRLPVIDEDGEDSEVGDLPELDQSLFKPAAEVLPDLYAELLEMNRQAKLRGRP
jgi:hypothetical protein